MSKNTSPLNWAILGTGVVANEMAQAFENTGRSVYAIGNRTHSKAVDFAKKYGIKKVYDDFHQLFSDPAVDIVYITTPHNFHIDFLRKALKGGKHVLCEKSITLNSAELEEANALAAANNVILAEAMTLYHMPLHKALGSRVHSGEFGEVRLLQLNFGSYKEYDMENRFFNKALAGGALLDIGVYAISMARFFMCSKPDAIKTQVKYAPSGADEQAGILMTNPDGQMAVISLSLHSKQPKRTVISCDKAYIEVSDYPRADEALIVYTETGQREVLKLGQQSRALQYEMEDMEAAVRGEHDALCREHTRDVMQIMTDIRKEWDYYYDSETKGAIG